LNFQFKKIKKCLLSITYANLSVYLSSLMFTCVILDIYSIKNQIKENHIYKNTEFFGTDRIKKGDLSEKPK